MDKAFDIIHLTWILVQKYFVSFKNLINKQFKLNT